MLKKPFLKIIAGIENRDTDRVLNIVDAAVYCKVDALDICDDPEIIKVVKERLLGSSTNLFVSSLQASKLKEAANLGADYLELGNYDHIYASGQRFSPESILSIAQELVTSGHSNLSVTVPGYLSPNEQANLAQSLVEIGVPIIQTEGGAISQPTSAGAIGLIEKAKVTLANTIELKNACPQACIMAAGGLSAATVPLALASGAQGIGIGNAISKLSSQIEMVAAIRSVQEKMSTLTLQSQKQAV
jgi:thiamine monophosphate synthase